LPDLGVGLVFEGEAALGEKAELLLLPLVVVLEFVELPGDEVELAAGGGVASTDGFGTGLWKEVGGGTVGI
jgi:hypothetical protein